MAYDKFAAVDSSTLLFPPTVRANLAAVSPNYIINGDFGINQRAFSSTTTTGTYGFDRWTYLNSSGTTYSAQTFTAGAAPVAGYEAQNYARIVSTGQSAVDSYSILIQKIEDVRTLAGQTATVSFWARAGAGTPKVAVEIVQNFGSGGSPSGEVYTAGGSVTLSTSWTRYSVTVSVPSISGKTVGTTANTSSVQLFLWSSAGSSYASRASSIGIQSATVDYWGVQVESGAVATPFRRNANSIQGELAACQRYYFKTTTGLQKTYYNIFNSGNCQTASIPFPVPMRVAPSTVNVWDANGTSGKVTIANAGGSSQNNLTPPSVLDLTTTSWAYNSGGIGGTTGSNGMMFFSAFEASAEL